MSLTSSPTAAPAPDAAIQRHARYLRLDPGNRSLRLALTDLYLQAGRTDDADACLQPLRTDAGPDLLVREAELHLLRGQADAAELLLTDACATEPADPGLLHGLGLARYQQGRWPEALEALARADAAGLSNPRQARLHAYSLHRCNRPDAALAVVQGWLARQPQPLADPLAGYAALLMLDQGQGADAQRQAVAVLALQPDNPDAQAVMAVALLEQQRGPEAQAAAQAVLVQQPRSARAWMALGMAHLQQQQHEQAVAALLQATAQLPRQVGLRVLLAWALLAARQVGVAEATFREAIALDATLAEAHGGLAVALVFQNRRDEAERAAQVARRLDRRSLGAVWAQGALMALDGRRPQGEALVTAALLRPLTPDGRTAFDHIRDFARRQATLPDDPPR